jgi:choice-of-anchor B domain-containing protein
MILICSVLFASTAPAHEDLLGTRYLAPSGVDQGHCDNPHSPCRTLAYALTHVSSGDSIKFAAGTYDLSGSVLLGTALGKHGLRGGFTPLDEFREQDADANPTRLLGVDPALRNSLVAHGFVVLDSTGAPIPPTPVQKLAAPTSCSNGLAGTFPCRNVDYIAQVPLTEFATQPLSGSNVWGFVDRNDNREYAIMGHRNGTTIFDVTTPAQPRQVGTISGVVSAWREPKVLQVRDNVTGRFNTYAYVSTEGTGGSVQILDLTGLPNNVRLAGTLADLSRAHTVYVGNIEYAGNTPLPGRTPYLVVAGSNLASGALRLYDLTNPAAPTLVAPAPTGAGYMHDSTSLVITDNRTTQCVGARNPCELLIDFNETTVEIWDVTNKSSPVRLSGVSYPTASYVHSGWPTDDGRFVIVHDELDELRRQVNTQIYTLDLADLRTPAIVTSYTGAVGATDHNGYTLGNRYFVSHYKRGLVVFDLTNPRALSEVASFDTYLTPAENSAGTDGAWGVYPYLPSGTLLVSDIENGLFLLKLNETGQGPPAPPPAPPPVPAPAPAPAASGGGGLIDWALLLALGVILVWRQGRGADWAHAR